MIKVRDWRFNENTKMVEKPIFLYNERKYIVNRLISHHLANDNANGGLIEDSFLYSDKYYEILSDYVKENRFVIVFFTKYSDNKTYLIEGSNVFDQTLINMPDYFIIDQNILDNNTIPDFDFTVTHLAMYTLEEYV